MVATIYIKNNNWINQVDNTGFWRNHIAVEDIYKNISDKITQNQKEKSYGKEHIVMPEFVIIALIYNTCSNLK